MSGNQASFNGSSEWERFSRVAANPSGGSDGRWKVYALVFLIMLAVYIGLLFWWRKRKTKSCETFSEGETRSNDECIEDNDDACRDDNDDACRDDWSDGECGHEHEKPNQTKKEVNADANGTDKVKEKEKNKVDDSCDIDSSGTHSGSDSC
jgi:FtsZ-interacting cell division protein ZipA